MDEVRDRRVKRLPPFDCTSFSSSTTGTSSVKWRGTYKDGPSPSVFGSTETLAADGREGPPYSPCAAQEGPRRPRGSVPTGVVAGPWGPSRTEGRSRGTCDPKEPRGSITVQVLEGSTGPDTVRIPPDPFPGQGVTSRVSPVTRCRTLTPRKLRSSLPQGIELQSTFRPNLWVSGSRSRHRSGERRHSDVRSRQVIRGAQESSVDCPW